MGGRQRWWAAAGWAGQAGSAQCRQQKRCRGAKGLEPAAARASWPPVCHLPAANAANAAAACSCRLLRAASACRCLGSRGYDGWLLPDRWQVAVCRLLPGWGAACGMSVLSVLFVLPKQHHLASPWGLQWCRWCLQAAEGRGDVWGGRGGWGAGGESTRQHPAARLKTGGRLQNKTRLPRLSKRGQAGRTVAAAAVRGTHT